MDVLLFGTGTLEPEPETASAGLAVREGEDVLALDLGRNVLSRMAECGVDPLTVEQILLTHLHPDHCCELVSLLFALNYAPRPPRAHPLRLVGPVGLSRLVHQLAEAWRWLKPRDGLDVVELAGEREEFVAASFEVTAIPMAHGEIEAFGYRVRSPRQGRTMAYTGDTGPGPGLIELARDVDLLVAECSWPGPREPAVHLWPRALGRAAAEAGCGRLVVTHLYPGTEPNEVREEIAREFDGSVELGRDRQELRV